MTRTNPAALSRHPSHRGANALAVLISIVSISVIAANFQTRPLAANPRTKSRATDLEPPPPPLPRSVVGPTPTSEAVADDAAKPGTPAIPQGLSGRMALLMNIVMLEKGTAVLEGLTGYTAVFSKQERIGGKLLKEQIMQLKLRHRPFSVYMKWTKLYKGQQVLYVDGQNGGKMIVKLGGWKKRLPALKLDPTGKTAMKENRYPITKAGVLGMIREALKLRRADIEHADQVRCRMTEDVEFAGRPCWGFVVEYADRKASPSYRKAEMLIDKEWSVPVMVRNFTWPEDDKKVDDESKLDEDTLLEYYTFRDFEFMREIAQGEFDRKNKAYRF